MPDQEIIIEGDAGFVPKASPSDAGKVLGVLNSSGDVGWVVDQSGTFIQVQADWAETDSSQPSYIDHKPDLSVYATASGVETALAGKQDTISDLSEIRAGAAKGDTAVQPSTLESYATTSAMNTALAGKQDVINDLSDIRSGASAGATAVQPSALDSYATTSAMNTALAGKQDTISDLATIRSGASAGATAVQPATLESYATTSAMNTALASKQDTISDLSTIRAGAAAGATAAQPADLPSSDELVPSASSGDAGKVLTVDNQGNPGWVTPSAGTVYTPGDGIDITSDVISAKVDGTTIGIDSTTKQLKSLQTIPSVDQTYNASSTNAQSGTAVAQAIASIPSSSYTAGDGIKISSNTISADFEVVQPCLTFGSDFKFDNATQYTSTLSNNTRVSIPYNTACKFTLPGNLPRTIQTGMYGGTLRLQIVDPNGTEIQTLKSQYFSMGYMNVPIPENFYKDVDIPAISDSCYLRWQWLTTAATELTISNFDSTAYCFYVPYTGTLALTSPLPASTSADANKVLTVDSNGAAGWQNVPAPTVDEVPTVTSSDDGKVLKATYSGGQGSYAWGTDSDTTYTAGNMIAINANNSNAIGVSTTAGITDIQVVNALPASPVATVLYLIPST